MDLTKVIEARKTIKMFNPNVKISREEMAEMLTIAQLAPSKANLQPWRYVIVDDAEKKKQLLGFVGHNAPPCESASAVILVLADLEYQKVLGDILDYSVEKGCLMPQFRDNLYNFLLGLYDKSSDVEIRDQVLIDTSLATMQLMLVAKDKGYDTHAIGIFDRDAVMNTLEVDSKRYAPVMLLAIGKAATTPIPSVRLPLEYTVSWNDGTGFRG
ncbi:nitroreductase family protein [Haemophilus parahaemolyticus]